MNPVDAARTGALFAIEGASVFGAATFLHPSKLGVSSAPTRSTSERYSPRAVTARRARPSGPTCVFAPFAPRREVSTGQRPSMPVPRTVQFETSRWGTGLHHSLFRAFTTCRTTYGSAGVQVRLMAEVASGPSPR